MNYYVIDAFSDKLFSGNPAGVCLPDQSYDDNMLQQIAFENNLAETAFALKQNGKYTLRWFTPEMEMDLCGHATLATAFVILNFVEPELDMIKFDTRSGEVSVKRSRNGELYTLNFPSRMPVKCEIPQFLEEALGAKVLGVYQSRDLVVELESEEIVRDLNPNFNLLEKVKGNTAFIVTAKASTCDFVSRFFETFCAISEDPVTGSAHCSLIPFWKSRLGKSEMVAKQLSRRGGTLFCKDLGERVEISGKAVCYLKGSLNV